MGAGPKAKPLGTEGWMENDGSPAGPQKIREIVAIKVKCACGWGGSITELLGDDGETLWCPECRRGTWVYA